MADAETKISVHSLADLKNTSDDAIPNYLNSLKFTQSHTLSDIRLALGYAAFLLCAACFYWDYKLGFESTKLYTAAAVAVYAFLNGALTFWIWGVEKGKVYVGTSPSGETIEIATSTKKHTPVYYVSVTVAGKTVSLEKEFMAWFDNKGHFVPLPFQQMLAGEVPVIAKADPRKVVKAGGKVEQTVPEATYLAAVMDGTLSTGAEVSVADVATPRKGKGKKKA